MHTIVNNPPRLWLAALFCTIICGLVASLAHAQGADNRLHAQVQLLETKVQVLEARLQKQELASIKAAEELAAAKAQFQLDLTVLKSQVDLIGMTQLRLVADVEQLKSNEPGKPDKPSDQATARAPFVVKDAAGNIIFRVDVGAGNAPRAVVGSASGARIELVADPKGSHLRVSDAEQSAGLGKFDKDGVGLFLRRGDKEFGELAADKAGAGILRVFGTSGRPVGAMFSDADGGRVALTSATGGKTALSLSVTPTGGKVRLFPAEGGSARAELSADGATGSVNLFASDGTNAASLSSVTSKAGRLQLTNGRGNIAVEAGADSSTGKGMVSAGPFDGGVAGTMGGAMEPASSIVGRSKAK
jgi:hypothetical protein